MVVLATLDDGRDFDSQLWIMVENLKRHHRIAAITTAFSLSRYPVHAARLPLGTHALTMFHSETWGAEYFAA